MSALAKKPRVAFQGERGAFSEEAAVSLLGEEITLVPCPTFESLFVAIDDGIADYALVPVENTIAGSVHRVYDLLLNSPLEIAGEAVIPVVHNLIGCADTAFASIEVVESHPVALAQCEKFFAANPQLKRIATDDTAASVRRVVEGGDPTRAAVAGSRAARIYAGSILREHLEDHRENYTRFFLLALAPEVSGQADKVSLVMRLSHQPGSLHRALGVFARRGINLLKIESRPIQGRPWQYYFYLDLKGSVRDERIAEALAELREQTNELRDLGCYQQAQAAAASSS